MLKTFKYGISIFFVFFVLILGAGILKPVCGQSNLPADLKKQLADYNRENRFDDALLTLDVYLDTMASRKGAKTEFEAMMLKADVFRMKGQNRLAAELLDSLMLIKQEILTENDPLSGQLYTIQGTLYLTRGELKKGRTAIEKAIEIYSANYGSGDTLLGPCYNKLGNYYYFIKEYDSAMVSYSKALELARKKKNNKEELASYIQNLGIIYLELSDYANAESCFLMSLSLKEELYSSNSFSLGRLYLNLGRFYQGISALDKALIYISKAENIYSIEKIPAALELGSIYWNKGLIYHLSGDSESALAYLFNAKEIIDSVFSDNQNLIASLNSDIGNVYRYTGQNEKAIFYYNSALSGADSTLKKKTYRNLANLYHLEGDNAKADLYFNDLLSLSQKTIHQKNPENAQTFLYYGFYLLEAGNDNALYYLNKALDLFNDNHGFHSREVAASLYMIGDYYFNKNQTKEALNYYQKSLIAISSSFTDTNIFNNPDISSVNPDIRLINALSKKAACLGKLYQNYGDLKYLISSINTYNLCFELIDQIRLNLKAENSQMLIQYGMHKNYYQAIENHFLIYELTKDKTWLEKAFSISEKGKSMVLLNELKDANAKKISVIPDQLTKTERVIKSNINLYRNNIWEEENQDTPDEKKLSFLRSNLLLNEKRYDSIIDYLEQNYPDYYRLKYDASVVTVKHLQDMLEKDEAIVEYSLSANEVYLFLITPDQFEVKKVTVDTTLVEEIFKLRDNLDFNHVTEYSLNDYMEYQITAFHLYSKLVQPITDYIENKKLIIIPDAELNYLSFESLVQSITPSDTIAFRRLPYLIKKWPVSYAPSSTIYALIKKGRGPVLNKGVLALAPSQGILTKSMIANNEALAQQLKDDHLDLPGAIWEAETILKVMKGMKLIGEEATESEFKKLASSFDILHFATHTRIDDENPLSSMLSFYPYGSQGDDGVLHTYEIYSMDLTGELAVLSACSTGNGKLQKGEGVISLARAFTYAGMPSVVMTLWDVEDISTGNIVPFFYQLLGEGYDKDIALRQSKLNYLEKTKTEIETHPAFWSGFVLYGNNRGFRQKTDNIFTFLLVILGVLIILISFVLARKYLYYRKNLRQVSIGLPTELWPEDRL